MYNFIREETVVRKLRKRSTFVNQGQDMTCCYFLLSGSATVYLNNGKEDVFVRKVVKDEALGLLQYLGKQPYPYHVITNEETIIAEINNENINSFISTMPEKTNDLLNFFAHKIEENNDYLCMSIKSDNNYEEENTFIIELEENILKLDNNRKYKIVLPKGHESMLYSKEISCPICKDKFKANHIKYSSLKHEEVTNDFRIIYKDFDDLWYQIWTCPHCSYSNFQSDFYKISHKSQKYLFDNLPRYSDSDIKFQIKTTLNDVIDDYIHLNHIMSDLYETVIVKVRLLQSLVWLMGDVNDLETQLELKKQLLIALQDLNQNSPIKFTPEDEVKIAIRISLLMIDFDDLNSARALLLKASQLKNVTKAYKTKIQDVIELTKKGS